METLKEYQQKIQLREPETVFKELADLKDQKKELFVVFYLDTKNAILSREIVHIGTLNSIHIHPREIFKGAILRSAANIIIAHNHPSGDPEPSDEDRQITQRLKEAGKLLGIPVLDHVIVGSGSFYSFKT